jgi:hypothetical protein
VRKSILAVAVFILAFASTPLFAFSRSVTSDVIRMTKAGVDEGTIIQFVKKTRGPIDLTGNDIVAMKEAGVTQKVIRTVIDEADGRDRDSYDGRRSVVVVSPYAYPYPYYYDPFWYPYYWGPSLSFSFGFGGYRHFGGGFGHGGHFHGRH